jgi:dTDP-3-amino-3,4,6-trideoxy-alpha-D-glucose transaminase
VTTRDTDVADRVRLLRFHGSRDKVSYQEVGYNSRLDELQAAILRVMLPHLDGWAERRRAAGRHYEEAGLAAHASLPRATDGSAPAWHLYVVAHPQPQRLEDAFAGSGIGCKPYYRTPVHRQEAMKRFGAAVELPATELAAARHLAIPMGASLTRAQADEVAAAAARAAELAA